MTSAGMAEYDLTQRMAPSLDCHLVFPLLDFLQERKVHPDEQILLFKMELLMKTHMVDYAWSVHKSLFNSNEVPKNMVEKRAQVDARLRELEGRAAPVVFFLENPYALQYFMADRDYNLQILRHRYQIGPEQMPALYEYAKFLFESGQYSVVAKYFDLCIHLSTNLELCFRAMWGKLAAEILMKNWETAVQDLYRLKDLIDLEDVFESPMNLVEIRLWLLHWSLFIFFNHDKGRTLMIDLFNQDKYFNVIQTNAPHLFRYLVAAFIMTESSTSQFKNFIEVVQSGQCLYEDPITEFFTCLYINFDFDGVESKMEKCVGVILSDPFLGKRCEDGSYSLREEFGSRARLFILANFSRTHHPIEISALVTREGAERCTTIQDSKLDAGIDEFAEHNHSNVSINAESTITKDLGNDGEGQTIFGSSENLGESQRQEIDTSFDVSNAHSMPLPSNINLSNERSSETGLGLSQNLVGVCQSQQINHTPSLMLQESSSNAIDPLNSIIPTVNHENQELTASIFQPLAFSDSQPMASLLSSLGIGYSPSARTYLLDVGLQQNNIVNYGPLDGRTMANTEVGDAYFSEQGIKIGESHEMPRNYEQVNSNKVNGKRKRKKTTSGDDGKRCSCQKSQCLKRYCECFSAGLYCGETCTCEDCINGPEYEETVLNSRSTIETRNPSAFTPDLVPRDEEQSLYGGTQLDLINARHRRGCSCKKSTCIKNYCDCYQANVKCSEGCRCVGCKNTYVPEAGVRGFL